jgi:hypothetical protein
MHDLKETGWTDFVCKTCNPRGGNFYAKGKKPKKPITRETVIVDKLELAPRYEMSRRAYNETVWNKRDDKGPDEEQ